MNCPICKTGKLYHGTVTRNLEEMDEHRLINDEDILHFWDCDKCPTTIFYHLTDQIDLINAKYGDANVDYNPTEYIFEGGLPLKGE